MGRNDPMRNHLGRIRIMAKLQCHPATFPYMIFLHRWPFCIRHHFTFVFVLSVAVIVRFAIESFCSVFSSLFRDWDRWFYKDHRSFFNFYMFYDYNCLFCRNVFFTLSAAHSRPHFNIWEKNLPGLHSCLHGSSDVRLLEISPLTFQTFSKSHSASATHGGF